MSYVKVRQEQESKAEQGPQEVYLPCVVCSAVTLGKTLSTYGARCYRCYTDYCNRPPAAPEWMADKRAEGPKAWAHALRIREQSGERLSSVLRTMWRAALKHESEGAAT